MTTIPTQFPEWMALASAEGRYGESGRPPSISRGRDRVFYMNLETHPDYGDWTDGAFTSAIRAAPGSGGSALATWTISVGTPASGVTPVTFTLPGASQGSLPADTDANGVGEAFMEVVFTPTGGTPVVINSTRILIVEAV